MMNLQFHTNTIEKKIQEANETWKKEISSLLPQNLENIARETGILQRKRGISSITDLLKVLFLYAVSGISFRMLSAAAKALRISDISDTAWRKQFHASTSFLKKLLQSLLCDFLPETPSAIYKRNKNVFLVDGSILRQQGKEYRQQRIHFCYCLNRNRVEQIKLTDTHIAESLRVFSMGKDDLILADAGYGTAKNYAYSQEQKADVILRITPSHFSIYNHDRQKYDMYSILQKAKKKKQKIVELFGFCQYEGKRYSVRVIAQQLSPKESAKAQKRKTKESQKNQCKIKEETLFFANYVILITSLGVEYGKEEIAFLYKSRWQVELLLKRWKQNLSLTMIRFANENYAEVIVLLWLILWVLTEKMLFRMECFLKKKAEKEEVNHNGVTIWTKCQYTFFKMKEILCMSWSLFVSMENKEQRCCLAARNGQRVNQNEYFRFNTLPSLIC